MRDSLTRDCANENCHHPFQPCPEHFETTYQMHASRHTADSIMHCPACKATVKAEAAYRSPHNQVDYTLQACSACGLKHWSPLLADVSIYRDDGFDAYREYHAGARPFPRWAEPLFEHIAPNLKTALDIGCGDGSVMQRLQANGVKSTGIDLDTRSVAIAQQRCGEENCHVMTLEEFSSHAVTKQQRFDLVTFFEVLEHQVDPRAFLAQVHVLLTPEGRVAGSVPNRDRFLSTLDRRIDSGDLPPHHHLWFSERALRRLLEMSGYEAVTVRKVGSLSYTATREKLVRALSRYLDRFPPALSSPLRLLARAACYPLTLIPWLGRKFAPSHLFFECRNAGPISGDRPQ